MARIVQPITKCGTDSIDIVETNMVTETRKISQIRKIVYAIA